MFKKAERLEPLRIITLGEAKAQLNIIDFEDDDTLIEGLILTASELCEKASKKYFSKVEVTCELHYDGFPIFLDNGLVESIKSVVDTDGNDVEYNFSLISNKLSAPDCYKGDLVVTYLAGYDRDEIPELIKHCAKIIVSDLYNNRESEIDSKTVSSDYSALKLLKTNGVY